MYNEYNYIYIYILGWANKGNLSPTPSPSIQMLVGVCLHASCVQVPLPDPAGGRATSAHPYLAYKHEDSRCACGFNVVNSIFQV